MVAVSLGRRCSRKRLIAGARQITDDKPTLPGLIEFRECISNLIQFGIHQSLEFKFEQLRASYGSLGSRGGLSQMRVRIVAEDQKNNATSCHHRRWNRRPHRGSSLMQEELGCIGS